MKRRSFEEWIDKSGTCWIWTGHLDKNGYGRWSPPNGQGNQRPAHKEAYERWVRPVPAGYHVDHLCFVRACVNPTHLRAIPAEEHMGQRRAGGRRGTCPRGHPYDYVYFKNDRVQWGCKTCRSHAKAAHKLRTGIGG